MGTRFSITKVKYWQATSISRFGALQTEYFINNWKQFCMFDFERTWWNYFTARILVKRSLRWSFFIPCSVDMWLNNVTTSDNLSRLNSFWLLPTFSWKWLYLLCCINTGLSLFLVAKGESMDVYRLLIWNEFSAHFFSFHKFITFDFREVIVTALMNDFSREIRWSLANYY